MNGAIQLPLWTPAAREEEHAAFLRRLAVDIGPRFIWTWTNNRARLVTISPHENGTRLVRVSRRLIHLSATGERALVRFILNPTRRNNRALRRAFAVLPPTPRSPHRLRARPQGRTHDLAVLMGDVVRRFAPRFDAVPTTLQITWGRSRARRHRSIRLGSYTSADRLIRIHPALDDPRVPAPFVAWIVYHELLHALLDRPAPGRTRRHTPLFRQLEREFPDAEALAAWETENLAWLF